MKNRSAAVADRDRRKHPSSHEPDVRAQRRGVGFCPAGSAWGTGQVVTCGDIQSSSRDSVDVHPVTTQIAGRYLAGREEFCCSRFHSGSF
jgi:hypothetical protein